MRIVDVIDSHSIRSVIGWPDNRHYGLCPLHSERHASFSVYYFRGKEWWKCHSHCGSGDVIDLVGRLQINGYDRTNWDQRRRAAEILDGNYIAAPVEAPPPIPELPNWLVDHMLPPSPKTILYALSRGITRDQIDEFKIGTPKPWMKEPPYNIFCPSNWMAIPTFSINDEGGLVAIKLRSIVPNTQFRFMSVKGSQKGLWGAMRVLWHDCPILLLKSEIPAIIARRVYSYTCAPTGEGNKIAEFAHIFSFSRKTVIVADNDEAGKAAALAKSKIIKNSIVVYPPEDYKDFDQAYRENPKEMKDLVKEWTE